MKPSKPLIPTKKLNDISHQHSLPSTRKTKESFTNASLLFSARNSQTKFTGATTARGLFSTQTSSFFKTSTSQQFKTREKVGQIQEKLRDSTLGKNQGNLEEPKPFHLHGRKNQSYDYGSLKRQGTSDAGLVRMKEKPQSKNLNRGNSRNSEKREELGNGKFLKLSKAFDFSEIEQHPMGSLKKMGKGTSIEQIAFKSTSSFARTLRSSEKLGEESPKSPSRPKDTQGSPKTSEKTSSIFRFMRRRALGFTSQNGENRRESQVLRDNAGELHLLIQESYVSSKRNQVYQRMIELVKLMFPKIDFLLFKTLVKSRIFKSKVDLLCFKMHFEYISKLKKQVTRSLNERLDQEAASCKLLFLSSLIDLDKAGCNPLILMAIELNSPWLMTRTLGFIGEIYMSCGDFAKALFYFVKQVTLPFNEKHK